MIRENKVKKTLKEGENAIGTFAKISDPSVIEVLSYAGFDFFVIDTEHTAMNEESVVNMMRAADITGIVPMIRVSQNAKIPILKALDSGALGLLVPQVETKEEAIDVVNRMKYDPAGQRGFAAITRAAGYASMDPMEYARISNENTLVGCYCETADAVKNIEEIAAVEGVDLIFIGPYDLSQSLGVIGEPNHPKVQQAIEHVINKVRAAGKAVGIIAADAEKTQYWLDKGAQFICLSSDHGLLASAGKKYISELKK